MGKNELESQNVRKCESRFFRTFSFSHLLIGGVTAVVLASVGVGELGGQRAAESKAKAAAPTAKASPQARAAARADTAPTDTVTPAAAIPGQPPLQAQAQQIVRKVGGEWGVMAWSIDRGDALFAINPNDVLIPASNNKVFSSIWALAVLGPDYRFPTDVLITGPIENGVLRGDVVIRGSGDPAFGYPDFEDDPLQPLRTMALRLKERGVQSVEGSVIGDPFVFDTMLIGRKWPGDTGGGSAWYAPGVSGLPYYRNTIGIQAKPNPGGGAALIELIPAVNVIPVVSQARTGGGRAWAARTAGEDTIYVNGGVSGRGSYIYRVGVSQPALLTTDALRAALTEAGIQVRGASKVARTPAGAKLVHRHLSIPLSYMMRKLNQESDNFFAEHVWKAAAAKAIGEGSFDRGGAASALHFMRSAGVPLGQLYQFDGSGLSAFNRASPNAMVRSLIYAHRAPFSGAFHGSLAMAGDPKGTLRNLFRGTPASGNLHAKTGYINDVRTLSGYVRAKNGELIAFSFLYNGRGTSAARGVQTELGTLLADFAR
ncbi:MAG: D-alanyl-D-alanine carboxypeptidase/D-alanyl-D-alanine-endopeptidase [Gemmatimonadetes bacterium]|nr:D-alanyl-D-alanine carboxypeptidase/D-alanyl-D-alanine-endopeptidase [Gemmatimonadota bacterium]